MSELKRILCPVDFSDFSRRALDHALGVARCYRATVTALHVVPLIPVTVPGPYYFGSETPPPMTLPPVDRVAVAAQLERLVAAEHVPGVNVEVLVEEGASAYREILAQADRLRSDLIVIGTHGRSGFERLFLGSTAEKVLRKARCPVMTVPPQAPDAMPRGPVPFTRILCAVDFSASSKLALDYAMSLAEEGRAALTLVHIIELIPLNYDFFPPAVVDIGAWSEGALTELRRMVPGGVRSRCAVTEVVDTGKPYRKVLELAAESHIDLIVMGVQGRSAADLFFLGSTAQHVVRDAPCAVLTLRS
jgi:nucleotide-binding universal stress UspA family protein